MQPRHFATTLGRYEQAIESYDQAIALQPDHATSWYNRGNSLDNLGRYEQAIESYDQAIALQPDDASAWYSRGTSLAELDRYEQAIESYDQAIALQPDYAMLGSTGGLQHFVENNIEQSSAQFVPTVCTSLTNSKQQLLQTWQPPDVDSLTQSLEQSIATSAQRLKQSFPQIADTFSSSLSPTLRQFLSQPPNLEPLHALLRQPITESLTQWLEQSEQQHPHHTNPDLNQRGYRANSPATKRR